jgi:hypothetical protein
MSQGMRTNNSQDHRVNIYISDGDTPSDENEKKLKVTFSPSANVTLKAPNHHYFDHANL